MVWMIDVNSFEYFTFERTSSFNLYVNYMTNMVACVGIGGMLGKQMLNYRAIPWLQVENSPFVNKGSFLVRLITSDFLGLYAPMALLFATGLFYDGMNPVGTLTGMLAIALMLQNMMIKHSSQSLPFWVRSFHSKYLGLVLFCVMVTGYAIVNKGRVLH